MVCGERGVALEWLRLAFNIFAVVAFCVSTSFVVWTYVVYPFVVRLLRPYYKPIKRKRGCFPSFSVIVAAHNEASVIGKKLENLLSLDYPQDKVEIIVVDDGSTDNTAQIVGKYDSVKIIKLSRVGKTEAINKGLKQASGEIVLLTDADCFFDKENLVKAAQAFFDESIGAVTGSIKLLDCEPSVIRKDSSQRSVQLFYRESLLDSIPTGMGGFLAFRRKLIEKLDPNCLADDVEVSIRVRMKNFRVIYDPQIVTYTWDPNTFGSWYKQTVRRTLQGLSTLFQHKSVLFNPKYGWYGVLILPTRLLLHRLTPFFLIITLLASFFVDPILSFALIAISLIAIALAPRIRKMSIIQFVFLHAWILFFSRRYESVWERGPRSR